MTKIVILGGGPAGYVAALRAAQLGASVTLVEQREIGGTCLNRGCIPTKSLVASAETMRSAREAAIFGVLLGEPGLDFATVMQRKDESVRQLREGVEHLLKARKVEIVHGHGRLVDAHRLAVELIAAGDDDSPREATTSAVELTGDAVILASGSEPVRLPMFAAGDSRVMTSDEILGIEKLPASLLIIGGGVIGCEFAAVFAALGTKVTIVEMLDQLLAGEDKRTARTLQQALKKQGIEVRLGDRVAEVVSSDPIDKADGAISVRLAGGEVVTAQLALVSVGRKAVSRGLGYEEAGVQIDGHGFVVTDETLRTAVAGVFAAGDLAGPPLLAHWGYHEGAVAAENAVTGGQITVDRRAVPSCVFTHPEVASVGLTEDRAAAEGRAVDVTAVRFNGNSKAVIDGQSDGYIRLVLEPGSGIVLGASLVGPHVTELVHEIALAVSAGLPVAAIAHTIHAHPSLSETVGEVAMSAMGRGVHSL